MEILALWRRAADDGTTRGSFDWEETTGAGLQGAIPAAEEEQLSGASQPRLDTTAVLALRRGGGALFFPLVKWAENQRARPEGLFPSQIGLCGFQVDRRNPASWLRGGDSLAIGWRSERKYRGMHCFQGTVLLGSPQRSRQIPIGVSWLVLAAGGGGTW